MKQLFRALVILGIIAISQCGDAHAAEDNKHLALVLSDNASDSRKKLAYIVVDAQGLPSIYPSPLKDSKTGKQNELADLSLDQIRNLWGGVHSEEQGVYSCDFVGYPGHWATFKIDLRFESDRCQMFRVHGPGITNEGWISTKTLKYASNGVALPPWIGCVEGPFDTSRCGSDIP
jgi:hypothetical protein